MSKEIELAAAVSGVKLQFLDIQSPKDFETAFQAATKVRAQAVLVRVPGPTLGARRAHFPELAVKNRLPAMYERAEDVEVGGLMSYGAEQLRLSTVVLQLTWIKFSKAPSPRIYLWNNRLSLNL